MSFQDAVERSGSGFQVERSTGMKTLSIFHAAAKVFITKIELPSPRATNQPHPDTDFIGSKPSSFDAETTADAIDRLITRPMKYILRTLLLVSIW